MFILGLTGSLGSGKSVVAAMMAERGAHVIDADQLARDVVEPGSPAYEDIVREFGRQFLREDGKLDRAALAREVFSDPDRRRRLEAIIHPRVEERRKQRLASLPTDALVVLEIPLLFETGADRQCDATCVVAIDEETRRERLRARGMEDGQIQARLAAQLPQEEKIRRADHVIDNSGDPAQTRDQVDRLMMRFKNAGGR